MDKKQLMLTQSRYHPLDPAPHGLNMAECAGGDSQHPPACTDEECGLDHVFVSHFVKDKSGADLQGTDG